MTEAELADRCEAFSACKAEIQTAVPLELQAPAVERVQEPESAVTARKPRSGGRFVNHSGHGIQAPPTARAGRLAQLGS